MTSILELNDVALTLYRDDVAVHRSPGIALVLDDEVQFGDDALRLSRIYPRQANQQYLSRLNADPLPVPGRRARNHADLVYLHLLTFKPLIDAEGGEVLLAVPGVLSPDQLGVLLGVLQEVGIRVTGFVDAAVAALSTRQLPPRAYHLDVMMQRAVVTAVDADGTVRKSGAQELTECGMNRLLDGWINVIADRFVRETRFDPLHAAATEQQLFNQVYEWIERGADTRDLVVEIDHAEHTRRVELGRSVLDDKAAQRFRQIADALPDRAHVFVSARSARLPGLRSALETLNADIVDLPDGALAAGCLRHLAQIVPADGELRLVTALPALAGAPAADHDAAPSADTPPPTHVLSGAAAWPVDQQGPLPLRRDGARLVLDAAAGVRLNGDPLEAPLALVPGDRVTVGERDYLIIHVRE